MTDRVPICPINIEHVVMLSDKYDAYTCIQCDIWLEKDAKIPSVNFVRTGQKDQGTIIRRNSMIPLGNALFISSGVFLAATAMQPIFPSNGEQKTFRFVVLVLSFLCVLIGLVVKF